MSTDIIRYTAVGLVVLIMQFGMSSLIEVRGIQPDLVFIFCYIVTVKKGRYAGLVTGFLAGLMQDILSANIFGVQALAKCTVMYWFGLWVDTREINLNTGLIFVTTLILTIVQELIVSLFWLQGTPISLSYYFIRTILPVSMYTAIICTVWSLLPYMSITRERMVKKSSSFRIRR